MIPIGDLGCFRLGYAIGWIHSIIFKPFQLFIHVCLSPSKYSSSTSNGSIMKCCTAIGGFVSPTLSSTLNRTAPPTLHHRSLINADSTMPRSTYSSSTVTTVLLCFLLLVSFFPGLFHLAWTLPFSLLGRLTSTRPPIPSPVPTLEPVSTMAWFQKQFTLPAKSRGSYLITDQVVGALPEIRQYKVGLLNLFVQHTSCALSLNENCKLSFGGAG